MLLLRALIHDPRWQPHWRALLALLTLTVAWFAFMPSSAVPKVTGIDKINHALAFIALSTAALLAGFRSRAVAVALLGYGVFIEVVQGFLATRQGDAVDVIADAAGIAVGLLLVPALRRLVERA